MLSLYWYLYRLAIAEWQYTCTWCVVLSASRVDYNSIPMHLRIAQYSSKALHLCSMDVPVLYHVHCFT